MAGGGITNLTGAGNSAAHVPAEIRTGGATSATFRALNDSHSPAEKQLENLLI